MTKATRTSKAKSRRPRAAPRGMTKVRHHRLPLPGGVNAFQVYQWSVPRDTVRIILTLEREHAQRLGGAGMEIIAAGIADIIRGIPGWSLTPTQPPGQQPLGTAPARRGP